MAIIRLQSAVEKRKGIFYQLDTDMPPIGEGGMGKVFEGVCVNEQTGATRPVAIKFMFDDLPANAYERARRESEIQLRNDNLVEMLGFIETQDKSVTGEISKHYHVVSELLTGVSLSDILSGKTKDRNGNEVPFAIKMLQDYQNDSEHFAQEVVMNVLSGLMALHDAGYIHRDIDPSNIMLTNDGHIKLIDFGIAKQMNTLTTGDKSLTVAGKFMGKPEYAAPELVLGDISHQNQTTDIYAVGILLYQCIIGHTPFEGPRHEVLEKQLKAKLPLSNIKSKALRGIIATACEKKQDLRYQTSAQMRVALETMNGSKRAMSNKKKISLAAIAAAAVLLLVGTVGIVKYNQNVAKEKAEKIIVEQQRQKTITRINAVVAEAERLQKIGLSKESEDKYEQQLIKAFDKYVEAEQMASQNKSAEYSLNKITTQKKNIINALQAAKTEMETQAETLSELGETETANTYTERAKSVEQFINKNK